MGEGIGQRGGNFKTTAGLYAPMAACDCAIRQLPSVDLWA